MSDTVIQVANLCKEYRLGIINHHTLTRDLQSWWAKLLGKEDPNSPIGSGPLQLEDRFWALKDVSFEVKQGDILGIIGRNGAGKSTLLKILSQVTAPTKGEVRFKGRIASLLEVGTGFHPELTGRENIFLNGAILGMSKAEISKKLDQIVDFAEIDKFIETPVKRYSSGMYVRLAFAVAAHLEPEILVVDEVLAVGDAQFQKKCLGKMESVGKEGRTILFVSHNMQAIKNTCNNVIWLNEGKIFAHGKANEIVSDYIKGTNEISYGIDDYIKSQDIQSDFMLNDIKIVQNGVVTNHIENGCQLEIHIEYTIKKNIRGFRVYYDIIDDFDNILIRTYHDDNSDFEEVMTEGRYISKSVLPSKLLSPCNCTFVLRATIESDFENYKCFIPAGLRIPLNVSWTSNVNRSRPNAKIISKFQPEIYWHTQRI